MSTLEFIASMVASLAWPITLCTFLLVFQKPILGAFHGRAISKISLGDTTLEFDSKAKEVASLVTATGADSEKVSEIAPATVAKITYAWRELEAIVRRRLNAKGVRANDLGIAAAIDAAEAHAVLTTDQANSLRGLLTMRNLALHSRAGEITEERATDFIVLASAIKTVLEINDHMAAQVKNNTAAAIMGQGELATMNYEDLKQRLPKDFSILKE
ncbi:MAG: hypothetical protein AB7O04_10740 [Hyphomonadaceae bacterium]